MKGKFHDLLTAARVIVKCWRSICLSFYQDNTLSGSNGAPEARPLSLWPSQSCASAGKVTLIHPKTHRGGRQTSPCADVFLISSGSEERQRFLGSHDHLSSALLRPLQICVSLCLIIGLLPPSCTPHRRLNPCGCVCCQ